MKLQRNSFVIPPFLLAVDDTGGTARLRSDAKERVVGIMASCILVAKKNRPLFTAFHNVDKMSTSASRKQRQEKRPLFATFQL